MKAIYINEGSKCTTISDDAYAQILELIQKNRVCGQCGRSYTDAQLYPLDRQCVARNLCLPCFLAKEERFTYAGPSEERDTQGYLWYKFLDKAGTVFLSSATADYPYESKYETLIWHGFRLPTVYTLEGKGEITLFSFHCSIYGDVKSQRALLVKFNEFGQMGGRTLLFLVYKDELAERATHDKFEVLDPSRGKGRTLLRQARARINATKDNTGCYHLYGTRLYQITEGTLYTVASEIAGEESSTYPD